MRPHQIMLFAWAVAGVAALAGCGHSKAAPSSDRDAPTQAEHAYEHHNPPHKPRDFPSGLTALRERFAPLFKLPASQSPAADKEFGKVVDIVGWLPELAADSDLERADWDRVNEQCKQLAGDVDEFARSNSGEARQRTRQQIEHELQSLDDVVRRHRDTFGQTSPYHGPLRDQKNSFVGQPRA